MNYIRFFIFNHVDFQGCKISQDCSYRSLGQDENPGHIWEKIPIRCTLRPTNGKCTYSAVRVNSIPILKTIS